ncbi:MAG: uracil-DNA glycosylase [Planctomycetota bacterium]|nr:uracil-DNA glycosylase [Planctomycetota bacterium]
MPLNDLWQFLQDRVFTEPSTPVLFNPYHDATPGFDKTDAARIRRENLKNYHCHFVHRPTVLLVGEAPGPKGCRFSGVPFTSEFQLVSNVLRFNGRQSSSRAEPYKEVSASTFWKAMQGFESEAFVWNCVSFHPHDEGVPLSIRAPSPAEIRSYSHILRGIVEVLKPESVVAIGRHAARALSALGITADHVRHPSHGGSSEFTIGVRHAWSKRGIQEPLSDGRSR